MPKVQFRKFVIIGCLRCHLLQVARTDRKTRKCPRCGYQMKLDFRKIKVFFKTDKVQDATYVLQQMKLQQMRAPRTLKGMKTVRTS